MIADKDDESELVLARFMEEMFRLVMDNLHRQIDEADLTIPQVQVLRMLRTGPIPTGQLAADLRISAPAATQLTDRLIRKQLIERRELQGDRRTVLVALSDRGRRVVDRFREKRGEIFCSAMRQLSDVDRMLVADAMKKVIAALEKLGNETAVLPCAASKRMNRTRKQVRTERKKTSVRRMEKD